MTAAPWYAERLVAVLEQPASSSGALRDAAYGELRALGVNVAALVEAERQRQIAAHLEAVAQAEARRRLLADRVESGRLTRQQAERLARQIADLDVQLKAQRQEANRIVRRLEARPAPPPSAPTAERIRHAGEAPIVADRDEDPITGETTPLAGPRYRLPWVIDRIADHLDANEYNAAFRLREAYDLHEAAPRIVDLSGAGGGSPGSRMPTSDRKLRAGEQWNAMWSRSAPAMRTVLLNFVCEHPIVGQDRPQSLVEFGRQWSRYKQEQQARAAAVSTIKLACNVLAFNLGQYEQWRADEKRKAKRRMEGAA